MLSKELKPLNNGKTVKLRNAEVHENAFLKWWNSSNQQT